MERILSKVSKVGGLVTARIVACRVPVWICMQKKTGSDIYCYCISQMEEQKLGSSAAKSREAASKNEMVGANGGVSNRRFP